MASRRSRAACPGARPPCRRGTRPAPPRRRARACARRPRARVAATLPPSRRCRTSSPPYLPGYLDHALELALLVVLADQVADRVGAEAALRAEGELLERQILCRLVDSLPQEIRAFQFRHLGAHQSQHHDLSLGHEAQRREAAGARAVVLEEKTLVRQLVEQSLRDRVVGSLAVPHAALVAAAEVHAKGDAIETAHDLGVCP